MTDQIFDARAAAFVGAREHIRAAQELKARIVNDPEGADGFMVDDLPAEYWALIAEAGVLAHLATADAAVGFLAGHYEVDQAQRIARNKRKGQREGIRAQLDELRARAAEAPAKHPDVTTHDHSVEQIPFTTGHQVKLTAGEYAGRLGQVYETKLSEGNPIEVVVELAPPGRPDDPSEPIVVTVDAGDLELAQY